MKGEFSRLSFDARRHFAGVLQQQGRVASDADWNEWVELSIHRLGAQTIDTIGDCGRPKHHPGFTISVAGSTVTISAGRFYSGGFMAELETDTPFLAQTDWPIPTQAQWNTIRGAIASAGAWPGLDFAPLLAGKPTRDLFYVEVWLRHLTTLNDEAERAQVLAEGASDWDVPPEVGYYLRERAFRRSHRSNAGQYRTAAPIVNRPAANSPRRFPTRPPAPSKLSCRQRRPKSTRASSRCLADTPEPRIGCTAWKYTTADQLAKQRSNGPARMGRSRSPSMPRPTR
jgi:hypothetical protein